MKPHELRIFRALERQLIAEGVPAERATEWARAQVNRGRALERKGRTFAMLALTGGETAANIAKLDAAGAAPRAWY